MVGFPSRTELIEGTGKQGTFVKSHLIPKALTKPNVRGNLFVEAGKGLRPTRRFSSWYDSELVTREGENILREYDTWAIEELHRLKLIWSSWGPMVSLSTSDWTGVRSTGIGLRQLTCTDPAKFRLFFLSLLWRAAATSRTEFGEIQLATDDLDRLQAMVRDRDPGPLCFYPTTLLQIASRGPTHNFAPIAQNDTSDIGGGAMWRQFTFRFYFDGLIAHMHRPVSDPKHSRNFGAFIVGDGHKLVVQTQPLDSSWQLANLEKAIVESNLQWPETSERRFGIPTSQREDLLQKYSEIYGHGLPWTRRKE